MSKKVILFWNPFFVGPEFEGSHQLILTSASALVDLAFFLILELIEISHFFFIHLKTIVLLSLIRKKSSSFENYFLTDKFRLNFKFIHKQDFLPRYLKKWKIFFSIFYCWSRKLWIFFPLQLFSSSARLFVRAVCQKIPSVRSALIKNSDFVGLRSL